jgi:hypothetical protein
MEMYSLRHLNHRVRVVRSPQQQPSLVPKRVQPHAAPRPVTACSYRFAWARPASATSCSPPRCLEAVSDRRPSISTFHSLLSLLSVLPLIRVHESTTDTRRLRGFGQSNDPYCVTRLLTNLVNLVSILHPPHKILCSEIRLMCSVLRTERAIPGLSMPFTLVTGSN